MFTDFNIISPPEQTRLSQIDHERSNRTSKSAVGRSLKIGQYRAKL